MPSVVPVIDVSPWASSSADARQAVVAQVAQACREIGFFAVTNHGVPPALQDAALQASRDFFDLPLTTKLQAKTDNEAVYPYGYENSENLARGKQTDHKGSVAAVVTAADLKETFSVGPSNPASGMPARRFPPEPAVFSGALTDYYAAMEVLSHTLLRIFAAALELPEDWFTSRSDHHFSALRILNYFPVDSTAVGQNVVRASAHTDYGPLTILLAGGPGLQCQRDGGATEDPDAWVNVPHLPDTFVINLGDLMQRWTNDRWSSTLHRVVVQGTGARRQSIAYFCNVNPDCVVDPADLTSSGDTDTPPPHYSPITAKEHLMSKHLASMGQEETK